MQVTESGIQRRANSHRRFKAPTLTHLTPQPFANPIVAVTRETISWRRKIFHMIGIGAVGFTYALTSVTPIEAFVIMLGFAIAFCSADLARFYIPALNRRVKRDFAPIMRGYELERLSSASWFIFTALITIGLFPKLAASIGFICLAFGDPLASWAGVRWGKTKLPGGKTLEGSLTLFVTCTVVVTLFLLGLNTAAPATAVMIAITAAAMAAVAEWLPVDVDDNFVMPPLTAAAAALAISFLL